MTKSVDKVLGRVQQLSRADRTEDYGPRSLVFVLRTRVLAPLPWNREQLERSLGVKLPSDLAALWDKTSGLRLFEDVNYGQWGLVIWGPSEIPLRNEKNAPEIDYRSEDFLRGDLLAGRFLGDTDLMLVRCDSEKSDFGSVLISWATRPRSEWPKVALSLSAFLDKYIDESGEKFWSKGSTSGDSANRFKP